MLSVKRLGPTMAPSLTDEDGESSVMKREGAHDPVLTGPVPITRTAPFRAEPTVSNPASHSLATEVGEYVAGEIRAEKSTDGFRVEMRTDGFRVEMRTDGFRPELLLGDY
ncbi:hypothetical protein M422DRAFT_246880 [Sphaerobolus stellatus SS14]|nr:hypothetical protein M422DRAFT_246880 [Sphaerobolus stellatus SS14]